MEPDRGARHIRGIRFLTLGTLVPEAVSELVAGTSARVAVPCALQAAPPTLLLPPLEGRAQLHADVLLRRLEELALPPGEAVVGLTDVDIGDPIFSYYFGRARRGGHAALVSLARLDPSFYGLPPDPARARARALREILHELGHVAGLEHCEDHRCVMHFARTIETIDLSGAVFCEVCRTELDGELVRAR